MSLVAGELTQVIIGASIEVHRSLGPGLLESAYAACLDYELRCRGLRTEREKALPLRYKQVNLDCGYRLDLVVDNTVVVELKSVDRLERIHEAQLLSYLRLSGFRIGLLINFNVLRLTSGVRRLIN